MLSGAVCLVLLITARTSQSLVARGRLAHRTGDACRVEASAVEARATVSDWVLLAAFGCRRGRWAGGDRHRRGARGPTITHRSADWRPDGRTSGIHARSAGGGAAFGLVRHVTRVALSGRLRRRWHSGPGRIITTPGTSLRRIGSVRAPRRCCAPDPDVCNLDEVRPGFDTQHLLALQVVADDQE